MYPDRRNKQSIAQLQADLNYLNLTAKSIRDLIKKYFKFLFIQGLKVFIIIAVSSQNQC